eukprot:2153836-Amphidinium_carterae.1
MHVRVVTRLPAGTVLRASATAWVLGSPDNSPILQRTGFSPAQYMHKVFSEGWPPPSPEPSSHKRSK